jgi:membrane-associated protease RseP (regulator of RpoE activity)
VGSIDLYRAQQGATKQVRTCQLGNTSVDVGLHAQHKNRVHGLDRESDVTSRTSCVVVGVAAWIMGVTLGSVVETFASNLTVRNMTRRGYSLMTLAQLYAFFWATFAWQTTVANSRFGGVPSGVYQSVANFRFGGVRSGVYHSAKIIPKEPKVTLSHRKVGRATPQFLKGITNSSSSVRKRSRQFVTVLSRFANRVGAVAILTFIALAHETGHFVAAKCYGTRIEEFSVGTGPKLFGFRTQGGTEINWRKNPGGFVRSPDFRKNLTFIPDAWMPKLFVGYALADYKECEKFLQTRPRNVGSRIANLLTLGLLEDKLWYDEKQRRIKSGGWMDKNLDRFLPKSLFDLNSILIRPWFQHATVSVGGMAFNFLFAYLIYFGQVMVGPGIPVLTVSDGIVVTEDPMRDTPAHGLLHKGDVILAVDNLPATPNVLTVSYPENVSRKAITAFLSKIRATPEGGSVQLTVMRPTDSILREVTIHPTRSPRKRAFKITIPRTRISFKALGCMPFPKVIGASISPNFVKPNPIQSGNPVIAAWLASRYLSSMTLKSVSGVYGLSGIGSPLIVGSTVVGVGGTFPCHDDSVRLGSRVMATRNWTTLLMFAAAQSIATAVTNSFPFMDSDGGQCVLAMGEAITGRKLNQKFVRRIVQIAEWWVQIQRFVEPWSLLDFRQLVYALAETITTREMTRKLILVRAFLQP